MQFTTINPQSLLKPANPKAVVTAQSGREVFHVFFPTDGDPFSVSKSLESLPGSPPAGATMAELATALVRARSDSHLVFDKSAALGLVGHCYVISPQPSQGVFGAWLATTPANIAYSPVAGGSVKPAEFSGVFDGFVRWAGTRAAAPALAGKLVAFFYESENASTNRVVLVESVADGILKGVDKAKDVHRTYRLDRIKGDIALLA